MRIVDAGVLVGDVEPEAPGDEELRRLSRPSDAESGPGQELGNWAQQVKWLRDDDSEFTLSLPALPS